MLNPPRNILANLNGAAERMKKVDKVLGEELPMQFAEEVSRMLAHADFHDGNLCQVLLPNKSLSTDVSMQLFAANAEFETAWNVIRLANVPASYRQNRVGLECVAFAVLMSLPTSKVRQLSPRLKLVKTLNTNPGQNIADLYRPIFRQQGKTTQRIDPKIKGNVVLP